jgi:energy-converting hydrogenase Eha subunit H
MALDKFEFVKLMMIRIFTIICVIKNAECQVEIDRVIFLHYSNNPEI